jgi:hypothetical protein
LSKKEKMKQRKRKRGVSWKIMKPSIYSQFGRTCGQLKLITWQTIDWNRSYWLSTNSWLKARMAGRNYSIITHFSYIRNLSHERIFWSFRRVRE